MFNKDYEYRFPLLAKTDPPCSAVSLRQLSYVCHLNVTEKCSSVQHNLHAIAGLNPFDPFRCNLWRGVSKRVIGANCLRFASGHRGHQGRYSKFEVSISLLKLDT